MCLFTNRLEEKADDLTSGVLATSLLVVHDTVRSGQDKVTELTGRQKIGAKLLDAAELDVEAGGDDTALVDATDEVDHLF